MQLINVQGRLGSDFCALALEGASDYLKGESPEDILILTPDAESREQLMRLARTEYAICPSLSDVRATTPDLAARTLLEKSGGSPRLATTGDLGFIIERLARSGVPAREAAREADRFAVRLGRLLPGDRGFDEGPYGSSGALGAFFEEHDLALWSTLPGFALHRGACSSYAAGSHGARIVYVLDAQDLTPASLFLACALAKEQLVLCCAEEGACNPAAMRMREGASPLAVAERAAATLGRDCEVREMVLEPSRRPETARVVWETVDEELSGIAAYLWKLLRENPDLEAQHLAIVAPNDQWAAAVAENLAADHLGTAVMRARNPLALPLRAPEAAGEHAALLRLRLAAHPDDELACLELRSIGGAASDDRAVEALRHLSGFSLAKAACRGLDAPFMQELLSRCAWENAADALRGAEERIFDPVFEAGPHDIRICTPKHAGALRARLVVAAGLADGLSASPNAQWTTGALQKASASADIAVFSRPRAVDAQAAEIWKLTTGRSVKGSNGDILVLKESAAFAEAQPRPSAPLVGEQLLSRRL